MTLGEVLHAHCAVLPTECTGHGAVGASEEALVLPSGNLT